MCDLRRQDLLTGLVPAQVELAAIAIDPILRRMVRRVCCAGRPVHEEWPGRVARAARLDHRDRLISEVGAQVVVGLSWLAHGCEIANEGRAPIVGIGREEAVEAIEALACRPVVERARRRSLGGRKVIPLAECKGRIARLMEIGGDRPRRRRDVGVVARKRPRGRGMSANMNTVRHPPGQEGRARG